MKYVAILLATLTVALAQQHSTVPVVLVDSYTIQGCGVTRHVTDNFGQLAAMLQQDGPDVLLRLLHHARRLHRR